MTKTFALLIFLLVSGGLRAQGLTHTYVASLPLYDGPKNIGDVEVEIENEKLNWIDRDSLEKILNGHIKEDTLRAIKKLPPKLNPSVLPFPVIFSPEELKLQTDFGLEYLARRDTDLGIEIDEEKKAALKPAPLGGAINSRLEQNWADEEVGGNFFSGQFSSFLNLNGLVMENQTYYQSDIDDKWFRGDTRMVKDLVEWDVRTQAGDIYPHVQGFMVSRPLGGLNIQRDFSLNPYRLPYPTGHQNFTLKARSFVKYFVNSVMVKSEYLPPGNYNAKDIPLNNGLNTVVIEATDDLGQKQVFVFRSSSNINLLNEGESRFDLSYGVPFLDTNFDREYVEEDGKLFSGFFQYGFSSIFSSSVYLQNQKDFNLYGTELIQAIPIGNLTMGYAQSAHNQQHGKAGSLGYQLITHGKRWFESHTFALRYENRSSEFKSSFSDISSAVQNNYAASYTIPVSNLFTFSLGANYGDVRDNELENRYGYDVNLSFRMFNHQNVSFFVSRNRDEFKKWNDVAYVFLTFTIPDSNSYASAFYDQQQKSGRVSVLRDNQNRLYSVRSQAIVEMSEENKTGELDLNYPTPLGDLGGRIGARENDSAETTAKGSIRYNSALAFAYQDDEFGIGLGRPIPGSFVIFKPEDRLEDQKIGLKSTSPYTESETGLFDEIIFSNLIAYQYRDIQLDPTYLDIGRSLDKEKFIVYPTYRSAHLITLKEKGSVILTGRLQNVNGSPVALQVGHIGEVIFFTNRDGEIFVEGLEAGTYELKLEGREDTSRIHISNEERGMKDIGTIEIEENEL